MYNNYNKTEYHTDFDPFGDADSYREPPFRDEPFRDYSDFRNPPPPDRDWSWPNLLSWAVDVGLLYLLPPVGVVFTVAHALGHDWLGSLFRKFSGPTKAENNFTKTSTSQRKAKPQARTSASARRGAGKDSDRAAGRQPNSSQSKAAEAPRSAQKTVKPEKTAKSNGAKKPGSDRVLQIVGWVLIGIALLLLLAADNVVGDFVRAGAVALGGGAMLLGSHLKRRRENTFHRCLTVCGDAGVVEIPKLAATLGLSEVKLDKLLTEMLDRGSFGPRAYIDHQRKLLVIRPEDMRDVYRREDEEKAKTAREQMDEYQRWLADIRQADVDIEDEPMSEKIRQMESLTKAIFDEIRLHPEKHSQITRFMNYYLPTTLKLLNSYARIEKQGVSGENMAKAKQDIEGIADTLIDGYKKQLDNLYRSESLDIAGDVAVLEKLMNNGPAAGNRPFAAAAQTQEV